MADQVAIIGSRDYPDLWAVYGCVLALAKDDRETMIVSGAAPNYDVYRSLVPNAVDTMAITTAHMLGLPYCACIPDWRGLGRRAGLARNHDIIAEATRVIAFWDGASRGTAHSLGLAHAKGIPIEIRTPAVTALVCCDWHGCPWHGPYRAEQDWGDGYFCLDHLILVQQGVAVPTLDYLGWAGAVLRERPAPDAPPLYLPLELSTDDGA